MQVYHCSTPRPCCCCSASASAASCSSAATAAAASCSPAAAPSAATSMLPMPMPVCCCCCPGCLLVFHAFVQFPLLLEDLAIQLVPVLLYTVLMVVIDRYGDDPPATWLIIWVVKLCYIWMLQCICCTNPLVGVELHNTAPQAQPAAELPRTSSQRNSSKHKEIACTDRS